MANEQQGSGAGSRQKIIIGVMVVVVGVIAWQVVGLFGGESSPAPAAQSPAQLAAAQAQMRRPEPAKVEKPQIMSEREAELVRLQQETETKYIAAVNELQMLKIEKEIAVTNKDISSAKLDSVKAQKGIVDLLTEPEPTQPGYGQQLVSPQLAQTGVTTEQPQAPIKSEGTYTVISVSQTHSTWNAVLGYKGVLYSVGVGDVMPTDGAKVVKIDKGGVVLEKEGEKARVSLVPII